MPGVSGSVINADDTREAAGKAFGLLGESDGKDGESIDGESSITSKMAAAAIKNMTSSEVERERQSTLMMAAQEANSGNVNYTGPVLRFNDTDYVRKDDVPKIVRESSRKGRDLVTRSMKNDPKYRRANS